MADDFKRQTIACGHPFCRGPYCYERGVRHKEGRWAQRLARKRARARLKRETQAEAKEAGNECDDR